MIDQFKPWYYAVAFAFMFSYCVGMPDFPEFQETSRHRRSGDAPRVEHAVWDQIMARRCEGQFARDWQMGFVSWNCRFKTAVNLSRTLWSYDTVTSNGETVKVTAHDLEMAAIEITKESRVRGGAPVASAGSTATVPATPVSTKPSL